MPNTNKPEGLRTLSTDEIGSEWSELQQAEKAMADAKRMHEVALEKLAEKAGKTFRYNNEIHQIRARPNKQEGRAIPYMTTLEREPREFLRKGKKKTKKAEHTETSGTQSTDIVHTPREEAVQAQVIPQHQMPSVVVIAGDPRTEKNPNPMPSVVVVQGDRSSPGFLQQFMTADKVRAVLATRK